MVEYECHAHIYSLTVPNDLPKMLAVSETNPKHRWSHHWVYCVWKLVVSHLHSDPCHTGIYIYIYTSSARPCRGLWAEVSNRGKYFNYCKKSMAFWPIGMSVRCRSNERLRLWINDWVPWNLTAFGVVRRPPWKELSCKLQTALA